jgi:hypothetical protein
MPKRQNRNSLLSPAVSRTVEAFGEIGGDSVKVKAEAKANADATALKALGKNLIPAVQTAIAKEQELKALADRNINDLNALSQAISEKK